MPGDHGDVDPAADPKGPGDFDPVRVQHLHDVVAYRVDDVFVEHPLVAERPEIELERLGLEDQPVGDVGDRDRREVRLARRRA